MVRARVATLSIAVVLGCESSLPPVPPSVERDRAPRLLAEETCRSLFDCDCPVNPYRDREHCHDVLELRGDDSDAVASAAGLAYDGVCVSRLATQRRELACAAVEEEVCADCRPFFGTDAEGEPCQKLGVTVDVDTCAQGLRCEDRICVPLCARDPILSLGERCTAGIEVLGICEPELHCDGSTQTCVASPIVGEPCPERICTQDAWCDLAAIDEPTCSERRPPGDACDLPESCTSGRCEDGRCAQPLASACTLPPP